ncbi:NHL repeat-containing protein [Variimorphobacter saccharofermentans]|nr:NHL repeat-containing protein [Variimorphobacter saccharofermentans]
MKKKKLILIPMFILLLSFNTINASANTNVPYQTYNYDYWNDINYTPAAYIPDGNISGKDMGIDVLSNPQDLFVAEDGRVYIADTGNNRIVVLNDAMQLEKVIDTFDNQGTADSFKTPSGIYVTGDNELYIADTDNFRVVALNEDGSLLKIISDPTSEVLEEGFVFAPLKVTVDYADRVYIIAKNMFQGIMAFDENSQFTGFSGTIKVTISLYEKIWRRFSTKAQRQRQIQFIPTEFTGVDMAPDGFIYATNVDASGSQSVRRLNPKGQDVIKKNNDKNKAGKLSGDLYWRMGSQFSGPSRIVDIVYRDNGIYSVVDMTRGRIFTYDHEGNILYIFGGMGSQEGTFQNPVAIEEKGGHILVLDSYRGEIVTFVPTQYGRLINEAVALRYDGDEASAVALWREVLKLDSNFELAYVGIGKSYLAAGDNKNAMKYLKLGMNREYYSIAFKRYRDEILRDNLSYILTGLLLLVVALFIWKKIKNRKGKGAGDYE